MSKSKGKFQISTAAMMQGISKLRLERGDALLVKNYETLRYLSECPIHLDFVVPLVFAPNGIEKLTRQDLLNLLEQLEQSPSSPLAPFESSSVPL